MIATASIPRRLPMGQDPQNLSLSMVSGLKSQWGEYESWRKRDLPTALVYVLADGVFKLARMEDHRECILV